MTVMMKEEKRMGNVAKTYLEVYTEYINGYKQYKMEKEVQPTKNAMPKNVAK